MSIDLRYRFVAASLLAASLAAAPVAAQGNLAKLMEDRLPKLCAELQTQGWGVPADQLKLDPKSKAEMRMGKVYLCSLGRPLAGKGPGRAPDLGALLGKSSRGATLLLSVSVWCAADREPALAALAKELERVLTGSKLPVPAGLLEATLTPRRYEAAAEGLRYRAEPIEVDPGACDRVAPGELGPVLMKMDVAVDPGA